MTRLNCDQGARKAGADCRSLEASRQSTVRAAWASTFCWRLTSSLCEFQTPLRSAASALRNAWSMGVKPQGLVRRLAQQGRLTRHQFAAQQINPRAQRAGQRLGHRQAVGDDLQAGQRLAPQFPGDGKRRGPEIQKARRAGRHRFARGGGDLALAFGVLAPRVRGTRRSGGCIRSTRRRGCARAGASRRARRDRAARWPPRCESARRLP